MWCVLCVCISTKPQAIPAKRMGVGAVLWEGELFLAAYLASCLQSQCDSPLSTARVIELGSGPGLLGIYVARCGGHAVITDKSIVLPLIEENVPINEIIQAPPPEIGTSCGGRCACVRIGVSVCTPTCRRPFVCAYKDASKQASEGSSFGVLLGAGVFVPSMCSVLQRLSLLCY